MAMMAIATLPAVPPLGLPPRSAYAAPSSKRGMRTQRPKSGLTCCPIRPFAPLRACTKDLTADIFYGLWVVLRRFGVVGLVASYVPCLLVPWQGSFIEAVGHRKAPHAGRLRHSWMRI